MLITFNAAESAVTIEAGKFCHAAPSSPASAIDHFYRTRDELLSRAYNEPFKSTVSLRTTLLLLLFSATETYFRRVIAEVLTICPLAIEFAATQQLPLGALTMLDREHLGLILSDTKGLTSSGELINRTKTLLGISIDRNSSLGVAIGQFERISNVRHCIVHSGGELLFNNRRELEVKAAGRLVVILDDKSFQDIIQTLVNVVRAYNNHVGDAVVTRWFVNKVLGGTWSKDQKLFSRAFSLFRSKIDRFPVTSPKATYAKALKTIGKSAVG